MKNFRRTKRCDHQTEDSILKFFTGSNKFLENKVEATKKHFHYPNKQATPYDYFQEKYTRLAIQLPKFPFGEMIKNKKDETINEQIFTYLLVNPHGIQDFNHPWKTMSLYAFENLKKLNQRDEKESRDKVREESDILCIPSEIINTHLSISKKACLYKSNWRIYTVFGILTDFIDETLSDPKTNQLIQYYDNNSQVQTEYHDHEGPFTASLRRDFQEYLNCDEKYGEINLPIGESSLADYVHIPAFKYIEVLESFKKMPDEELLDRVSYPEFYTSEIDWNGDSLYS